MSNLALPRLCRHGLLSSRLLSQITSSTQCSNQPGPVSTRPACCGYSAPLKRNARSALRLMQKMGVDSTQFFFMPHCGVLRVPQFGTLPHSGLRFM